MAAEGPKCNEKTEAECEASKTCTWLSLINSSGGETGKGACVSNEVANGPAEGRVSGWISGYQNVYTDEAKKEIDAWKSSSSISSEDTPRVSVSQLREMLLKPKETTPSTESIAIKKELYDVIEERKERLETELNEAKNDSVAIRGIVQRELGVGEGEGKGEGIISGIATGLSNLFSVAGGAGSVLASGTASVGSTIASGAAGAGSALASGTSTLINSIMKLETHEMLQALFIITRLNTDPDIKEILYGDGTVIEKLDVLFKISEADHVKKDIKRLQLIFTSMKGGDNYKALYLKYKAKYLKLKKELEV